MRNLLVGLLVSSAMLWSASARPQTSNSFSQDELQLYRMLLQHYPEKTGDLLGLTPETVAFPARTSMLNVNGGRVMLRNPAHSARSLPKEVMALAKPKDLIEKIKAQGEYVPQSRRSNWTRPDGLVRTHLALSDVAFSLDGQWAAMAFSANCGCKGGEGGIAVFHRSETGWQLADVVDSWIG